jgi:predicted phage tail protein
VREAEKGAIATFEARLAEIAAANKAEADRVAALKQKVEEDQAAAFTEQQNAVRSAIDQQIETRNLEFKAVQAELAAVSTEEQKRIADIQAEPRKDILTQTLALHGLFQAGSEGGQFALATYIVLTLLFMLVDTIPLIVKFFTKPGPYDTLLDRDEIAYDSEHRAFRESHQRYMEKLAAGNLIAVTRNKRLENALIDGVEHSRAAREFLDSLIEMEKSFAAKIRMEQDEAFHAGPEKIAALEAIKKRFYEDMQHRMEVFFAGQHA